MCSRVAVTVVSPEKPLCEGVKVKSKLQCGAQMVEVPELWVIMGGKLQAWREASEDGAGDLGPPKPFEARMIPSWAPDAGHLAAGFGVCPAGCWSFLWSHLFLLYSSFFPLGMGMFILCQCILKCWFSRSLQVRDCLESQMRLWTV